MYVRNLATITTSDVQPVKMKELQGKVKEDARWRVGWFARLPLGTCICFAAFLLYMGCLYPSCTSIWISAMPFNSTILLLISNVLLTYALRSYVFWPPK